VLSAKSVFLSDELDRPTFICVKRLDKKPPVTEPKFIVTRKSRKNLIATRYSFLALSEQQARQF